VNIGAGLDTTFYSIDNGSIRWYDLDLPNVIDIRRRLLPETDRTTSIARSIFDSSWYSEIKHTQNGVFLMAAGVLFYFDAAQGRQFFLSLADNLPGAEIVFDTLPKLAVTFTNWNVRKAGMKGATVKWALRDANEITKWDSRDRSGSVVQKYPKRSFMGYRHSQIHGFQRQVQDLEYFPFKSVIISISVACQTG
jgi:O-methyltransferase involved in polyketide biosynthesis